MSKWKIHNRPTVIPEIIDGDKKFPHHDDPIVLTLIRKSEHIALFLKASGQKEKVGFKKEKANSGNTILFRKLIKIKIKTE